MTMTWSEFATTLDVASILVAGLAVLMLLLAAHLIDS
jgi:preprotein translocase subunit Sec61beta